MYKSIAEQELPIVMSDEAYAAIGTLLAQLPVQIPGKSYDDDIYMLRAMAQRVGKRAVQFNK